MYFLTSLNVIDRCLYMKKKKKRKLINRNVIIFLILTKNKYKSECQKYALSDVSSDGWLTKAVRIRDNSEDRKKRKWKNKQRLRNPIGISRYRKERIWISFKSLSYVQMRLKKLKERKIWMQNLKKKIPMHIIYSSLHKKYSSIVIHFLKFSKLVEKLLLIRFVSIYADLRKYIQIAMKFIHVIEFVCHLSLL